ncbi:MAG: LysR family transcriptional regulator [Lautropia sp.]
MHNPLDMVVFAKVVELGSFAAAAGHLQMSRSSASKHVSRLEAAFKLRLLNRTTRQLQLTDAGNAILAHCARISQEAQASEVTASLFGCAPEGLVRISSAAAFARLHLAPALPALLARHPGLNVELVTTDRAVDLVSERIDIAITSDALPAANLAARRLVPIVSIACASKGYLASHGTPASPEALTHHACLTYRSTVTPGNVWRFRGNGREVAVPIHARLSVNNNEILRTAALQGAGIALLPTFVLRSRDEEKDLLRILPDYESVGPFDPFIALHYIAGARTPPKIKACVEFLAEHFAQRGRYPVPPGMERTGRPCAQDRA